MGKRHVGGSTTVNANTQYIGPFDIRGERLALVLSVANGDLVDVVVQGTIKGVGGIRWIDTALEIIGANDQHGQITPGGDGTIFAVYNSYRVKVTSTGANEVIAQLIELD